MDTVGYKSSTMNEYVPAIAFTLYDGYYIYSPYTNVITGKDDTNVSSQYKWDSAQVGLRPYIYYSCRYTSGIDYDFVITYTLDNYITVDGIVNGSYVNEHGYVYEIGLGSGQLYKKSDDVYTYDGIDFSKSSTETLKEYVGDTEYAYVRINGKKYYYDPVADGIFYIDNTGGKNYSQVNKLKDPNEYNQYYSAIFQNKSAFEYYKNAYEFSNKVYNVWNLDSIKIQNSKYYSDQSSGGSINETSLLDFNGNSSIFDGDPLDSSSIFNQWRRAIIRYVVETNLNTAIREFSSQSGGTDFKMPKLSESDWETIEENVCAISFVQGLKLGSKKYNGYAVVANTLSKEYVDENDIYIVRNDGTYCKADDASLKGGIQERWSSYYSGILNINFQYRRIKENDVNKYYYPTKGLIGSYTSIVGSSQRLSNENESMLEYLKNANVSNYTDQNELNTLKKIYYASLGRERWESFNVNNIFYDETTTYNDPSYFLNDY